MSTNQDIIDRDLADSRKPKIDHRLPAALRATGPDSRRFSGRGEVPNDRATLGTRRAPLLLRGARRSRDAGGSQPRAAVRLHDPILGPGPQVRSNGAHVRVARRWVAMHGPATNRRELVIIRRRHHRQIGNRHPGDPVIGQAWHPLLPQRQGPALGEADEDGGGAMDMSIGGNTSSGDALYDKAVAVVARDRKASTSYIQRRLQIGYNRAARMIEAMEMAGVVSSMNTNGSREVLAPGSSRD